MIYHFCEAKEKKSEEVDTSVLRPFFCLTTRAQRGVSIVEEMPILNNSFKFDHLSISGYALEESYSEEFFFKIVTVFLKKHSNSE